MPFLALLGNPIVRYAGAALGILLAIWAFYGWAHHRGALGERAGWEKVVAEQKAVAAKLYADKLAEIAAIERDREALNTKLSQEVSDARQKNTSAVARFNAALAVRLREQARSAAANCAARSAAPPGAARDTELEAPGIFLDRAAIEAARNLASVADDTAAVMKACQKWAIQNGR
jgi:hypothetical protein